MKIHILQTPVDPFDPSRGLDEREVYKPYSVLRDQYAFAHITEASIGPRLETVDWVFATHSGEFGRAASIGPRLETVDWVTSSPLLRPHCLRRFNWATA